MKCVQILMSTYNGEKYIYEQINSILKQKDIDVKLLIRDDGSSDKTIEIIKEISLDTSKKIELIIGENIGVKASFLKLIELSDSQMDYYAFADQDDIWESCKISRAVEKIGEENDIPVVYGSNIKILNQNGSIEHKKISKIDLKFIDFCIKNYFPGCTMVFNPVVRKLISKISYQNLNNFPLHDHWVSLVTLACGGKIVFDENAYIYYRQHSLNVVGAKRTLLDKLHQNGFFSIERRRYRIVKELNDNYFSMMPTMIKEIIGIIRKYDLSLYNEYVLVKQILKCNICECEKFLLIITIFLKRF